MMWIKNVGSIEVVILPILSDNYCYLLHDIQSATTAVVDPGEGTPVLNALEELNWSLHHIFCTHHHSDHIAGVAALQRKYNSEVWGPEGLEPVTHPLHGKETATWVQHTVKIFAVPGHTLDHLAFYFPESHLLFCGDLLFSLGCGRVFEGSPEQMWHSLKTVRALPPDTWVFCGHEYTKTNASFALSIDPENKALQKKSEWIAQQRAKQEPTIPFLLGDELQINPFLRADHPEIKQALALSPKETPEQTFANLRERKNKF